MVLARVDGRVVSTICHPSMKGWRVLICQPLNESGEETEGPILAIDPYGADKHQKVILASDGFATRQRVEDEKSPLRYMVIGMVDEASKKG